ncbi:hypothetical protein RHCRD62_40126 [Rhodococcus sp. RD6.2]|nr:hypothetical protein RHCRD62_40126 [Rhodococcus sp. RD6.2]
MPRPTWYSSSMSFSDGSLSPRTRPPRWISPTMRRAMIIAVFCGRPDLLLTTAVAPCISPGSAYPMTLRTPRHCNPRALDAPVHRRSPCTAPPPGAVVANNTVGRRVWRVIRAHCVVRLTLGSHSNPDVAQDMRDMCLTRVVSISLIHANDADSFDRVPVGTTPYSAPHASPLTSHEPDA